MNDKFQELFLSREWRIENLFKIVDENGQEVPFKLRPVQRDFIRNFHTYNVILKARQLGFTTLIDVIGLDMSIFTKNFTMVIIAETKEKAADIFEKKIIFPYEHLPSEIKNSIRMVSYDRSGEVKFSNGSSIQVMVSARSGTCQFLHVSEYGPVCANSPKKALEIKTGSFPAVHRGNFIFIESTAMGNTGYFYEIVKKAWEDDLIGKKLTEQEYKLFFYPWWRNDEYRVSGDVIIPERILKYFDSLYNNYKIVLDDKQMKWYTVQEGILHEQIWSEFPSFAMEAFKVAQDGAYYARQFEFLYRENRICKLPYEQSLPVYKAWDLGMSDETAIWFFQVYGKEIRCIDYYQNHSEGLLHYKNVLEEKGYKYARHFAPHDIAVRELSTGVSRLEAARKLGIDFVRIPTNKDLLGGIEQVRQMMVYCWFDESKCEEGLRCLKNYKREWDDKYSKFKDHPCHDDTSHGADAFRTFAVAWAMGELKSATPYNRIKIIGGLRK